MVNVSNNGMRWVWVYLVRAINAIYTIRTIVCVCWDAARNGKLPTISSLSTLGYVFALLRFSILIRKTLYGLFGCCWLLCLFSFRFWCVINAHRKFQQHHDTNKRRSASSMLWLGSARWMNKISWPRSMQNGESSFVCLSLCLSVRLSSCLRISVYFFGLLISAVALNLGIWMTSCPRLNYGKINRPISIIFPAKG